MKIVFMGNPVFAVPSLQALVNTGQQVTAVVTTPDRPMGRGRRIRSSAVAEKARELNLPLIQPDTLAKDDFIRQLTELEAELFVVVAFRILPRKILAIPKAGSINLHGSLLPKYRGAAPVQWALINGDKITGLTTFIIQPHVDTGDILAQKKVTIDPEDNYGSLSEKMSIVGADLLARSVAEFASGHLTPRPQDDQLATKAPKITADFCAIDWQQTAEQINNKIRGLAPRPGAYTTLNGRRLKIYQAAVHPRNDLEPGSLKQTGKRLLAGTGAGQLAIRECQAEGKRRMTVEAFMAGNPITTGMRFDE